MKPQICNFLPIPDLLEAKSILCIQPHPDDMEIGAGASLARLARLGAQITCLTVTDGSAGTYDPSSNIDNLVKTRRKETEKSAEILGVNELLWLDFADGGNLPLDIIRTEITSLIRKRKPQAVLVCDPWLPYEAHSDHNRTGLATAEASLLASMPNFCPADLQDGIMPHTVNMIAFYYTAYPNTFIDVSTTWEQKMAAIDCHVSQFSGGKKEKLKAYLTARARELAESRKDDLVEALKVLSIDHLHIFEEAWQC